MNNREDFLNRLRSTTLDKEPISDEGFELTEKTINNEMNKYDKVLKTGIIEEVTNR